jgi:hypothetical protein
MTQWESRIPVIFATMPNLVNFSNQLQGTTIDYEDEAVVKTRSQLMVVFPKQDGSPAVGIATEHIARHLYNAVLERNNVMFWATFEMFWHNTETRTSAGWLWECHVIRELSLGMRGSITLRLLPSNEVPSQADPRKKRRITPVTLTFPPSQTTKHGGVDALADQLVRFIRTSATSLFVPAAKNQATFDAFSISDTGLVTLFQATIRQSHPIKVSGLDFLWDAIAKAEKLLPDGQERTKVRGLRASNAHKWRMVFMIPQRIDDSWKTPQNIEFAAKPGKRRWNQYIEQYALKLKDDGSPSMEISPDEGEGKDESKATVGESRGKGQQGKAKATAKAKSVVQPR